MHTLVRENHDKSSYKVVFRQPGSYDVVIAHDYSFEDALKLVNYLNGGDGSTLK